MLDTRQGGLRSVVPHRRWESKSTPQALSQRRQAECDIAASQARVRAEFKSGGFWCHIISPKEWHFGEWTFFLGSSEILAGLHHIHHYTKVIESLNLRSQTLCWSKARFVGDGEHVRERSCTQQFYSLPRSHFIGVTPKPLFPADICEVQLRRSALLLFFGNSHGI